MIVLAILVGTAYGLVEFIATLNAYAKVIQG